MVPQAGNDFKAPFPRTRFLAGWGALKWCFLLAVSLSGVAGAGRVVESPLLRGGDPAVALSVDVTGEKEILLTATVGPDNSDYDQAIWAEPQFVLADGTWVDATKLSVPYATVGWGSFQVNQAPWVKGRIVTLGASDFARYFAAHAPSVFSLAVPAHAVRFEAKVGLTKLNGVGSSVFRVETGVGAAVARARQAAATAAKTIPSLGHLLAHRKSQIAAAQWNGLARRFVSATNACAAVDADSANGRAAYSPNVLDAAVQAGKELDRIKRALMIDLNPALAFDQLLFIRRKNRRSFLPCNWQSNSMLPKDGHANELCLLDVKGPEAGRTKVVYTPPNGQPIADVELHWNADRLLFSGIGTSNAWHVLELDLASKKVRQVTPPNAPDVNCYDACYVPDGHIIFTCTALKYAVPCVWGSTPVANLFRAWADGSGMELLANDQEHAWCPEVMPDGRVMYLRWEYTDIPHAHARILFTCNPDGTNQRAFYGSNSFWPNSMFYARPIPGKPTQFVAVLTGHHGLRREGRLGLFDVTRGTEEGEGAIQLLPGYGKKVDPIVRDRLYSGTWPMNLHPYPLDDTTFLVARRNEGEARYSLYLIDRFDNEICLLREADHDLCEPVPLMKTPVPHPQPDRIDPARKDAQIYVADIYEGPGLKAIPRGTVKSLRVYTYTFGFHNEGGVFGVIGLDGPWDMRRILGTVPVNADGSVYFRVPANTPIAVQPLDAEGQALQVMRSWFTARPGEYLSCAGCHEKQAFVARTPRAAANMKLEEIQSWRGPTRNYEFLREVQPVLDAFCVRCHHEADPADREMFGDRQWKPDLRPTKLTGWHTAAPGAPNWMAAGGHFTRSYFNLVRYVRHPGLESDIHLFEPMEWHAETTELMMLLDKGHHGVTLSAEARDRLVTWIDLNAPFHGRWQTVVGEAAKGREALRERRREQYAGLKENHEKIETPPVKLTAPPPRAPLPSQPPLTVAGWPFDPAAKPSAPAAPLVLAPGVELPLVAIPGGTFVMGSNDAGAEGDERPAAAVRVAPFQMGAREVTNREFREFDPKHDSRCESRHNYQFGATGYDVNGDDLPVVRVSWTKAVQFCAWLSKKTGRTVRLPTEAEWEWAARAGSTRPFWWGADAGNFAPFANLADISLGDFSANCYENDRFKARFGNVENIYDNWIPQAHAVNDGAFLEEKSGKWKPNPWGLFDLHGNVAEWTQSKYRPYPYVADDGRNAPDGDERRVVRGGSWMSRPKRATASYRRAHRPYAPVFDVGFRIVVE